MLRQLNIEEKLKRKEKFDKEDVVDVTKGMNSIEIAKHR